MRRCKSRWAVPLVALGVAASVATLAWLAYKSLGYKDEEESGTRSRRWSVFTGHKKRLIMWNPSSEASSPTFAFVEGMQAQLQTILRFPCDFFLVAKVKSDKEQQQVMGLLADAKCVAQPSDHLQGSIEPWKVLFCETTAGKRIMLRHIEPDIYVGSVDDSQFSLENIAELAQFIEKIVVVEKPLLPKNNPNGTSPSFFSAQTASANGNPVSPVPLKRFGSMVRTRSTSVLNPKTAPEPIISPPATPSIIKPCFEQLKKYPNVLLLASLAELQFLS